ncbi:hypothetical protein [Dyadobacter sp. 676]|uniref:T9SS type A sorting domain-containing protein n=1 Tax=Dyadobacter sp. 676 TaxID=3088362 RepID=A0AAU8FJ39_9BACT
MYAGANEAIARGQLQTEKIELPSKGYPSGIYLIKVLTATREKVFKVAKQR